MIYLASLPENMATSFREIARKMDIPQEFLAKILKTLVTGKLVKSIRGARGGYALARSASQISVLDVIEAVEGPVGVNLCSSGLCNHAEACTMNTIWQLGQERMLEVYRNARLDRLAMRSLTHRSPLLPTP